MTSAERKLWLEVQRRVSAHTPRMNRAILEAFKTLAAQMTDAEILRALASPDTFAETVMSDARFSRAFLGVRAEIHREVRESVLWFVPKLPGGGAVNGAVAVGFNILDPAVVEAIRKLDSRVMVTLRSDVREAVRIFVTQGIDSGRSSASIARQVRAVVGLAPNQLRAVENFRAALAGGDFSKALGYKLRDRRFDRTLRRLASADGSLSSDQVQKMTAAYRRKFIAWNANTNARTAVNDAQRLGKHLATQEAINAGILDGHRMRSRWVDSDDSRVRPLHEEADGEVVRFGQPFPTTGEVIPGESTFNCRCIKVDFLAPREAVA